MRICLTLLALVITLSALGCNSQTETDPTEQPAVKAAKPDTNSQELGETPVLDTQVRDIKDIVGDQVGYFRFVVCRASNLHGLAISRLELLAESDTKILLRRKFIEGVSQFLKQSGQTAADVESLAIENATVFAELAAKMTIERETSSKLEDAYAAYRVATIEHQDIRHSIEALVGKICERFDINKENQHVLFASIMNQYSVGWAGNDNDFVFPGWTDPQESVTKDVSK